MGQLRAIRLVKIDPFPTLKLLPFFFSLLNQSKLWVGRGCNVKPGSRLNTSNLGHSWRPTETTAVVFHTLTDFSLLCSTHTDTVYKHNPLHTHSVYSARVRHTPLRALPCGTCTVDCCHGLTILVTGRVCYRVEYSLDLKKHQGL